MTPSQEQDTERLQAAINKWRADNKIKAYPEFLIKCALGPVQKDSWSCGYRAICSIHAFILDRIDPNPHSYKRTTANGEELKRTWIK